jgi:hypothetical protein
MRLGDTLAVETGAGGISAVLIRLDSPKKSLPVAALLLVFIVHRRFMITRHIGVSSKNLFPGAVPQLRGIEWHALNVARPEQGCEGCRYCTMPFASLLRACHRNASLLRARHRTASLLRGKRLG